MVAYSMLQKCPGCGADNVVFGLRDTPTRPGASDDFWDWPRLNCHACTLNFPAVPSNTPLEGPPFAAYPTSPAAVPSNAQEVRADAG